ncbi:MAG: hypothetical protein IJH37_12040, partial [Clostridia bacterium]|nr:hypothetical protein [Clostridia bacterium]
MKQQRKELNYHNIISVHKTVIYPLLIAFIVSCFNVPAMALSESGSFDHLSDEALPTEAPEISEAAEVLP